MTPEGKDLTIKGEVVDHLFQLKREVYFRFSENTLTFHQFNEASKKPEPSLQMVFLLKGTLNYLVPNSKKPLLILVDQQHNLLLDHHQLQVHCNDEVHNMIVIDIDFSFFSRYLPNDHPGLLSLKKGLEQDKAIAYSKFNLPITPGMISILHALKTSTHTGFCEKLFLESKVLELLVLQLSQFEQLDQIGTRHPLKKGDLEKMYQVREILINNMQSKLSLRTLSHMVGTNEFNLKRSFKIAFGTTVYGYLNQYKMEQAKSILIEKDISIAEIAKKMGYKYATHFSSAFKKYFGYLPNEIRAGSKPMKHKSPGSGAFVMWCLALADHPLLGLFFSYFYFINIMINLLIP